MKIMAFSAHNIDFLYYTLDYVVAKTSCYRIFSQSMYTLYYVHLQVKYTLVVRTLKNSPYFEKTNPENGYFSTHFLTAYPYILVQQVILTNMVLGETEST